MLPSATPLPRWPPTTRRSASAPISRRFIWAAGRILAETGALTEAVESLDRAVQLDRTNPNAYANRARVHCALGAADAAEADLLALIDRGGWPPRAAQVMLSELGLYTGAIDGKFGPASRAALAAFTPQHLPRRLTRRSGDSMIRAASPISAGHSSPIPSIRRQIEEDPMAFRITGLAPDRFRPFYGMSDAALAEHNVIRYRVDACPGFPDRITMADIPEGETALLLAHEHLPVASPYRSSHAIFVREGAEQPYDEVDEIPAVLRRRIISLRAIDADGMIVDADLAEGDEIAQAARRMLGDAAVSYVHAHYAKQGCFAARIDRA